MMKKIRKSQYIKYFFFVVLILFGVRLCWPDIARSDGERAAMRQKALNDSVAAAEADSMDKVSLTPVANLDTAGAAMHDIELSRFYRADGSLSHHRIYSVPHFGNTFPDLNDIQHKMAEAYGVQPVQNRREAESNKDQLVYVGSNPYYFIDDLHSSIPYLVPRAAVLLQDIGRSFFDSLQVKGIPLHKIIVTSVLRSKDDVANLRKHNGNASQNSCHMYGTTFDVCYNRFKTVEAPGEHCRKVRNDTLKWVLSEVLRDMRETKRCYIKYEVHQGCFHMTTR